MSTTSTFVAVAGATGHLGLLTALDLRKRNVVVKALVRPGTAASRTEKLRDAGVEVVEVSLTDVPAVTEALRGATTIVSTLQGLRDVIQGVQGALLEAAVAAKVRRFIPSDYSLDFFKTTPGTNRNLDLRREFHTTLDASGIEWTSILNGGFMELLAENQLPMIIDSWHKVTHFGSADQKLDFTTVPDIAAFTAAVATDPNPTPKVLRIAGDSVSAKEMAAVASRVRGGTYTTFWTGSVGFLRVLSGILKFLIGGVDTKLMPPWQGMQYLENMVSGVGKLDPLDNARYPELTWTSLEQALRDAAAKKSKVKTT